ncbi:MAG: Dabb family protein [Kiritimatiellia bacterium]|jgi:hypothetical protein|nr:Dabb family protein [Kiritimatiellia bacterium]
MLRFRAIAIALTAIILSGCATVETSSPGEIHHVVLCWLKEPGNARHRQKIIETSETFRKIPGVQTLSVGQVIHSDRPIVDDSFDVAISMTFASNADLQKYLSHPIHTEAVDKVLKPLIAKITVYDFK